MDEIHRVPLTGVDRELYKRKWLSQEAIHI